MYWTNVALVIGTFILAGAAILSPIIGWILNRRRDNKKLEYEKRDYYAKKYFENMKYFRKYELLYVEMSNNPKIKSKTNHTNLLNQTHENYSYDSYHFNNCLLNAKESRNIAELNLYLYERIIGVSDIKIIRKNNFDNWHKFVEEETKKYKG